MLICVHTFQHGSLAFPSKRICSPCRTGYTLRVHHISKYYLEYDKTYSIERYTNKQKFEIKRENKSVF